MTEDREPYDDRADRAFRTAFEERSGAIEPADLDARAIMYASRRRTWWRTGAVAAAVLALVGGMAVAVRTLSVDDGRGPVAESPSLSSDPTAPSHEPTSPPSPGEPTISDASNGGELQPPRGEWRYTSYLDVVVQVPEWWRYDREPGGDWCAYTQGPDDPTFPTEPYVADADPYRTTLTIGCLQTEGPRTAELNGAPPQYWAPHLGFVSAADSRRPDGVTEVGDWTINRRTIGDVQLMLLTDPEHADLIDRILGSARVVQSDHNRCDASSPIQQGDFVRPDPAFDVTTIESVDSISVCQYDLGRKPINAGLLGSRVLTDADAAEELAAIQQAPAGGGPDDPEHCVDDMYGDTALVLRLHDGRATYDMYVYYDWCFGNGFDDGTTLRELTEMACPPLFSVPVDFESGSGDPFRRCHP